ncbi:MAG: PilZ domain-containing protein [Thermodesulfobacteriota bacterium]
MLDQRRHRRYHRQLQVNCINPKLAFESLTRDICPGGVFVITSHLLPVDSPIDLEISFGLNDPILHCRGRIAWINAGQIETFPPGFGVEFDDGDEQMIERLLQDLEF